MAGRADHTHDRQEADPSTSPRILLVEDQQTIIRLIRHVLGDDFRLDAVQTFDDAMQKARSHSYDLFLIDIRLGESRSGIDLLHCLRSLSAYENTPAVAVTAYALPGDERRLLQTGFDAYLGKPFMKSDLQQAVRHALSSA
jgi:CheY-like chemotaxis protein